MADDEIQQIQLWLRSRDEAAARWLVERYYPRVVQIAWRHLAPGQSVEDVAQEVFMKVFASLDRFDSARPFENWLARITTNVCISQLRPERTRKELRWADLSEEQAALVETAANETEAFDPQAGPRASEVLDLLLASLSAGDRVAFTLHHVEGRSFAEIAAQTGGTAIAARVRVWRARRKLRRQLSKLEPEPS